MSSSTRADRATRGSRSAGFQRRVGERSTLAIVDERPTTRFADVAGLQEAKPELGEIVEVLRSPERFARRAHAEGSAARGPSGDREDAPEGRGHGPEMAREVDAEVRRIVARGQRTARRVLRRHRELLERTAQLLLDREVLQGDDLASLFAPLRRRPLGSPDASAPGVLTSPIAPGVSRRRPRRGYREYRRIPA